MLPMLSTVASCAPPQLSYAPWDVGWGTIPLAALSLAAGIACVGILGSRLQWTADDHAPFRPLWIALVMLGFAASAAGLYVAFANQAHAHATTAWIAQASRACLMSASKSTALSASTTPLSLALGLAALTAILLGVGGAAVEWRLNKPRRPRPE